MMAWPRSPRISRRPSGLPDEGRLRIDDGWIVEDGVHATYREVWQREDDSTGDWLVRRWTEREGRRDARTCYLVAGGAWFLFARARSGPPLEQRHAHRSPAATAREQLGAAADV